MTCFGKKIALFYREISFFFFYLWIMSTKHDFWNGWALHFGQFKLNKYVCFIPQGEKKIKLALKTNP